MKKFLIVLVMVILIGAGGFFFINKLDRGSDDLKEVVFSKEIVYTLNNIERLEELPDNFLPKIRNEFLVLTVYGENNDHTIRKYNVFYFTFVDKNDEIFKNSVNTKNNAVSFGELESGTSFTGSVVFEVPKGSTGNLIITDENFKEIQKIEIK